MIRFSRVLASTVSQRGAVLPVAMIMLLVISLLAVAGMSDTTLQERMAGSMRDRDIAFQAAEAALRQGEQWVEVNPGLAAGASGLNPGEVQNWAGAGAGPSDTPPTAPAVVIYGPDAGVVLSQAPAFHVGGAQMLRTNPGETPAQFEAIYPVTAHALGATNDTVVILRSTYKPLQEN